MLSMKNILSNGWQDARALMLVSFVAAICLAVGHHVFYHSLEGKNPEGQKFNQNQNIYIGTAFAFLVKSCLSAAVCVAYAQVLWRTFLRQRLRVTHIDALSALATTPFSFNDWRLLAHFPLLVIMAAVAWCISVVTIFPPGTLSVLIDLNNVSTIALVPGLDFTQALLQSNSSRGWTNSTLGNLSVESYPAPPRLLASITSTITALTGEVPRLTNAESNSSYRLQFFGPALQCTTAEISTAPVYCSGASSIELSYLSFLTFAQDAGSDFRTFFDLNASIPIGADGNISCEAISTAPAFSFGPKLPELFLVAQTSQQTNISNQSVTWGWNTTTCQFSNSTYTVDVATSDSDQRISANVSQHSPLMSIPDYLEQHGQKNDLSGAEANKIYNYMAVIALMGQIVTGTIQSDTNTATQYLTAGTSGVSDTITSNAVPQIFSTRLTTSPELYAVIDMNYFVFENSQSTESFATGLPLAAQLEELFTNLTLAMLTNPGTSSNTTAVVSRWQQVSLYRYLAWHLWLAYGVGLLIVSIAVLLGHIAIAANGAPYSTKFSTFLRTTPWVQLETDATDVGADPMPREVAKVKISFGAAQSTSGIELLEESQRESVRMGKSPDT